MLELSSTRSYMRGCIISSKQLQYFIYIQNILEFSKRTLKLTFGLLLERSILIEIAITLDIMLINTLSPSALFLRLQTVVDYNLGCGNLDTGKN